MPSPSVAVDFNVVTSKSSLGTRVVAIDRRQRVAAWVELPVISDCKHHSRVIASRISDGWEAQSLTLRSILRSTSNGPVAIERASVRRAPRVTHGRSVGESVPAVVSPVALRPL